MMTDRYANLNRTYIYKWTENGNGPYVVEGNALAVYRAAIMIGYGRDHVEGKVLDPWGEEVPKKQFHQDIQKVIEGLP